MKSIDLFAGIGGNSSGAEMAGCDVLWAANHNPLAVKYHALNHTGAEHCCQDLGQADFSCVPSHDLMMASPCCQGHTKARGKEGVHHYKSRSTAWAPLNCVEYHTPDFFLIENVGEFANWKLFKHWVSCFESLGYSLSFNVLDCADYGVPQNRVRIYIIGSKSKAPFQLNLRKQKHVPVIDYLETESGTWSYIEKKGRAKSTLERVQNGRARYGDMFVMPYYGSGSGKTGRSVHRPLGTITCKDRWALVKGDQMRMLNANEYRKIMSFGPNTILPPQKSHAVQMLGNATCPVMIKQIVQNIKAAA